MNRLKKREENKREGYVIIRETQNDFEYYCKCRYFQAEKCDKPILLITWSCNLNSAKYFDDLETAEKVAERLTSKKVFRTRIVHVQPNENQRLVIREV